MGDRSGEVAAAEERTPLRELLSDQTGAAGAWDLKVFHSEIKEYTYMWQGKEVSTKKLVVVLLSLDADQYCIGIARATKTGESLDTLKARFATGKAWRFSKVALFTNEKPQYLHTACRIAINLRTSRAAPLLQSSRFPKQPEPVTTIAAILQLKSTQRFDLMAVPSVILDERRSGAGQVIVDVLLADGSETLKPHTATQEQASATLPLTVFLRNQTELDEFKQHVPRDPILFVCLECKVAPTGIEVRTVKGHSFWRKAEGPRSETMAAKDLGAISDEARADVAVLPSFTPKEAADYVDGTATLCTCSILDMKCSADSLLEDNAPEHVYQLNHVYAPSPAAGRSVLYEGMLFTVFDCWDFSKKIQVGFREKAMLSLAQCEGVDSADYVARLENHDINHPVLASLRVRVKKGGATDDSRLNVVVVEASPVCWDEEAEIPNDAVDALHGLQATGGPPSSEVLVAANLHEIAHSPFYNMTVDGEPAEKALVLLHFTQKSVGAQQSGGFRVVTDNVLDGAEPAPGSMKVGILARCSVERCPDFTAAKGGYALAVVCRATPPAKPQHALDLYIEAMETLSREQSTKATETLTKLRAVAAAARETTEPSPTKAWEQRKCRKLHRYPTLDG